MANEFEEFLLIFFCDILRQKLIINGIPKNGIKDFFQLFFLGKKVKAGLPGKGKTLFLGI